LYISVGGITGTAIPYRYCGSDGSGSRILKITAGFENFLPDQPNPSETGEKILP
jgi:hypothetical protein